MAHIYLVKGEDDMIGDFDWASLIPSFSKKEIFSPVLLKQKLFFTVDIESLCKLQRFRDFWHQKTGSGLLVNHGPHTLRGVRSISEQVKLEGKYGKATSFSFHCAGKAFDVSPTSEHASLEELQKCAVEFKWTGIGRYPTFLHLDTRENHDGSTTIWARR